MGSYRRRREKLKAHDRGEDRHNRDVAYEKKLRRLDNVAHDQRMRQRRRKSKPTSTMGQLESGEEGT